MNIYSSRDYRKIISALLSDKKVVDKSYTFQAMATYMRIQKPYLSKVINNRADFNSDQLYMCCKYLELDMESYDYLSLLLEYERSTYSERKEEIYKKILEIQDSKRDSKNIIKDVNQMSAIEFDNSKLAEYYLEPTILLVHIFLTIKRFSKAPDAIKSELSLSDEQFSKILQKLVKMKLIHIEEGKIKVLHSSLHLPRESLLSAPHQQLLRQFGQYKMNKVDVKNKKHFSATFSSNESNRRKIELEFNKFLSKVKEISSQGNASDCYQLNFDLFPWSSPK